MPGISTFDEVTGRLVRKRPKGLGQLRNNFDSSLDQMAEVSALL
jgi:hypothetical protein